MSESSCKHIKYVGINISLNFENNEDLIVRMCIYLQVLIRFSIKVPYRNGNKFKNENLYLERVERMGEGQLS